jgi:hypothetical protein
MFRGVQSILSRRAGHNEAQRTRMESVGILIASGLIAGEALTGLVVATFKFYDIPIHQFFADPSYLAGVFVIAALGVLLIFLPLARAGKPDEPPPPAAIM